MAKPTGEDKKKILSERLEEQRHLLAKSITEFAAGDLAEALRLAVAMRVLVHETGKQKPLLGQLTANYLQLEILDEIQQEKPKEDLPSGVQSATVMLVPISIQMTDKGVFLNPKLAAESRTASILGKWWHRPSLVLPGLDGFSRREIILGLADKEGGAHVDIDISQKYKQLIESKQLQVGWLSKVTPLNLSRFMAAQSAVELLDCLDKNFPKNQTD